MSVSVEQAVLDLLTSNPNLHVHDGYVTDSDEVEKTISAPLPYVIVYFAVPRPINGRLGSNGRRGVDFQITGVGEDRHQASWAANKAEELIDWALIDVDGRKRRIVRTADAPFTRRDDQWTRPDGGPLFNDARTYRTRT